MCCLVKSLQAVIEVKSMFKTSKTLLIAIISANLAFPSYLYADVVDDFKIKVEEFLAQYWKTVQRLVEQEKGEIAPSHVDEGIANSAFYLSFDAMGLISGATDYTTQISLDIDTTNSMATEFNNLTSSGQFSLDSYQKMIPIAYKFSTISKNLESMSNEVAFIHQSLTTGLNAFDGFCDREAPLLEFKKTPLGPVSLFEKPNYTYINPNEFSRDPIAFAYAEVAGAVTLVASMATFVILYGLDALIAAISIKATETGVMMQFGSGASGAGGAAWIPVLVIVVAFAVGNYIEKQENDKRKKEAKKAYEHLVSEVQKARDWFEANRLQDSEFRGLALRECKNNELPINPRTNVPGVLYSLKNQIQESTGKIKNDYDTQAPLIAIIKENSGKIDAAVQSYETELKKALGESLFAEHKARIASASKLTVVWDIYNKDVKPTWDRFQRYYISNRNDCLNLYSFYLSDVSSPVESAMGIIDGFKDDKNRGSRDFSQIVQMKNEILSQANAKIDLCISKMGA